MKFHVAAGLGAVLAMQALAASAANATLQVREAVLHTTYVAGFAIVGIQGEAGSSTPNLAPSPRDLSLSGSDSVSGSYLFWQVDASVEWDMAQTYTVDSQARSFSAAGSTHLRVEGAVVGPDCAPCLPTMQLEGQNHQALEFALDSTTPYTFASTTTAAQWVDLLRWDVPAQRWFALWNGYSVTQATSFSTNGMLQAGLYRVQNSADTVRANGAQALRDTAWEWTLTLPDASVSAVPELPTVALWAAGLAWLGWRRRPGA